MLMQMFHKRGKRGFTLVELLIVVAIIGVLSTIGVPTFRRMIQKSKKSEAKVNLGGVYTTEAAFYAEYNSYGNNLTRMGFEIEGAESSLTYVVGFYKADCSNQGTIAPTAAGAAATFASINAAFPAYYSAANTRAGAILNTACNRAFDAAADGTSFLAGASGTISPKAGAPVDVWSIDNNRQVANVNDGVQ